MRLLAPKDSVDTVIEDFNPSDSRVTHKISPLRYRKFKAAFAKTTMAVTMAALLMTVVIAGCGNKSSSDETGSAVSDP